MKTHYSFFTDYAHSFLTEDQSNNYHITLKKDHSIRVAAFSREIAQSCTENEAVHNRVELCGLLHDIARFEQFSTYKTFHDKDSFDHGDFGSVLINTLPELSVLNEEERKTAAYVTKNHNKLSIPEDNTAETTLTKIIRDADKLDIFYVMLSEMNSSSPSIKHSLPDTDDYSSEIVSLILEGRQVSYSLRRCFNDFIITMLGWMTDLNFPYASEHVLNQNIIEQLTSFLPQTEEIFTLKKFITKHTRNQAKRQTTEFSCPALEGVVS